MSALQCIWKCNTIFMLQIAHDLLCFQGVLNLFSRDHESPLTGDHTLHDPHLVASPNYIWHDIYQEQTERIWNFMSTCVLWLAIIATKPGGSVVIPVIKREVVWFPVPAVCLLRCPWASNRIQSKCWLVVWFLCHSCELLCLYSSCSALIHGDWNATYLTGHNEVNNFTLSKTLQQPVTEVLSALCKFENGHPDVSCFFPQICNHWADIEMLWWRVLKSTCGICGLLHSTSLNVAMGDTVA